MAPTQDEVLEICRILSEQQQLQVTLREAGKGFLIAGVGAAIGTLLGGRFGMLIGGSTGSVIAAICSQDKCRSVVDIIRYDMIPVQKAQLAASVTRALQSFTYADILILLPMVLGSQNLKKFVVNEIVRFLTNEMGLAMANNSYLQN